ncbi:hypothetical protein [Gymnodinialimonas ulvae]|uniref:hypothetical protein n=1 Tax=Gymnodinialimonas ulvae TaxID=3126504 RepID=UPI0030AAC33E
MARRARLFSSIAVTTAVLAAAPLHATTVEFNAISTASSNSSASASASSGPNGTTTSASASASGPGASASASSSGPVPARITFDESNGALAAFDPNRRFDPYSQSNQYGRRVEVWQESGFDVAFDADIAGDMQNYNMSFSDLYMSDTGCCEGAFSFMNVTRPDGASFSLDGMDFRTFGRSHELLFGYFQPEQGSSLSAESMAFAMIDDDLRFTGERADGSVVSVDASTHLDVSRPFEPVQLGGHHYYLLDDGPVSLDLDPSELGQLTDLVSLTISAAGDRRDIFDRSLPFMDLSSAMAAGYDACLRSGSPTLYQRCEVAGLGTFIFEMEYMFEQNYVFASFPGALNLSVNAAPAPVPLPAGGWLLIAAGGMLVGLRRRARARASA